MKPAELVALASAHGIDLQHVAGGESNTHGIARKRRMGPKERLAAKGRPIVETAEGSQSRVARPKAWSHAELGLAAGGRIEHANGKWHPKIERLPWLAAQYSWAGDRSCYGELHRGLTLATIKIAEKAQWPWQIPLTDGKRGYYIERLTELVLDVEGWRRPFDEMPGLYAICMDVTEQVWSKPVFGYFLTVQERYQRWLEITRATIQGMLRRGEEVDTSMRGSVSL